MSIIYGATTWCCKNKENHYELMCNNFQNTLLKERTRYKAKHKLCYVLHKKKEKIKMHK